MKMQIDIPCDINKKLKIEKLQRDFNTLSELVIKILEKRYKDE